MCIPNESLKGKMGKKFNNHVPTMYVYRKRSSLKILRINSTIEVPTICVLPMNLLKINTGMKFNNHIPTMYVCRERLSLKDIENKNY